MKTTKRSRLSNNLAILADEEDYNSDSSSSAAGSTKPSIINRKNKAAQLRRTIKERRLRKQKVFNGGPWSREERLDFLRGLRRFGPGKWRDIQTILTTRSNIQIKSHGQKIIKHLNSGKNIFEELEIEESGTSPPREEEEEEYLLSLASSRASSPCPSDMTDGTSSLASEDACAEDMMIKERSGPLKKRHERNLQQSAENNTCQAAGVIPSKKQFPKPFTAQRSVSINEANVVLALVNLADPVKLHAEVAGC